MSSSHSDAARMEQIITEFFAKSLHIILETRSPFMSSRNFSSEQIMSSPSSSSSSSSSVRPRDKWFNLALRECPEAMENLDLWRQSNLEPMVVDVILVKRDLNWAPISYSPKPELVKNDASTKEVCCFSDQEELGSEQRSEKVIERWVVQYELKKTRDSGKSGKRSSSNVLSILYKKSMLLLRSLYLTVRLLPAYKIFRDLNLTGQIHSFSLMHRVSSFAEPFTRREEAEMQRFVFTPVDTQCGRLCLSVLYKSSGSDMSSGPSTPMSPRFIPDYVGSPLADPLKKFSSVPTSHGSPSLPFSRRHSWSFDRSRASPTSVSYSPSPNSEPYGPASNPASHRVPPASLPINPPEPHPHKGSPCFDEFCPSPVFSPSPSPSPPIYAHGSQLPNPLLRSESAPVNIPTRKLPNSPSLLRNQHLPPSPPLRGSRCNSYKTDKAVVPTHIGATVDKMVAAGKEDRGYTGMRIPLGSSLQISLSRSSSRSYDYDETEYTCPFDMEYDDIMKTGNRPESFNLRGHLREPLEPGALLPVRKSHGAAVGTLVNMLNKAQPLSQEYSQSIITASSQPSITEAGSIPEVPPRPLQDSNSITASSSSVRVLKTTADALEELKGYRDIKNMLLKSSPA